jgi:hypothetical protein
MEIIARHRRLAWGLSLVLLLIGTWSLWPDRRLAQVKALRQELFSAETKKLPAEQRKDKWQALRQATEKLSAAQKQQLAREGQQRFEQELYRYAKMSKPAQTAWLDQQINRTQAMRNKAPKVAGQAVQAGKKKGPMLAQNRKPTSAEERERRHKQRLDDTTPEFRALMDRYRKDLQARMSMRGLPPSPWMRGGITRASSPSGYVRAG